MPIHQALNYLKGHSIEDFAHSHHLTAAVCGLAIAYFGGLQLMRMFIADKQTKAATSALVVNLGVSLFCEALWPFNKVLERSSLYITVLLTLCLPVIPACVRAVRSFNQSL